FGASAMTQHRARTYKTVRGMYMLLVVFVFGLATNVAKADDLTPAVVFHPGDTIHLMISFKESGVTLDGGIARFVLRTEPRENQKAFGRLVDANHLTKLSDREYEFSGTISELVASGEYQLNWISTSS